MCVNRANQCKISGSVRMSSSWFHASIKYIYILNTAHGCDVTAAAAATSIHSAICYRPSDIFMYSYMYTLNKAIFSYSHFILPSNWFYMSFNWCDRLADAKPSGTLSIASFIYCAFCVFFFLITFCYYNNYTRPILNCETIRVRIYFYKFFSDIFYVAISITCTAYIRGHRRLRISTAQYASKQLAMNAICSIRHLSERYAMTMCATRIIRYVYDVNK